MTLRQEIIIGTAAVALAWVLYAGMTGYLEHLDNQLIEAGINIWEWVR